MNTRSKLWFEEARNASMDTILARTGTDVIDSYEDFWGHNISDENLAKMMVFGLTYPEAASHRWSLLAGPVPWYPGPGQEPYIKSDPTYSPMDFLAKHRLR